MTNEGIPIAARLLLTERIGSIAQLEALLLLHALAVPFLDAVELHRTSGDEASQRSTPSDWAGARGAAAIANALRIEPKGAEQTLEELARRQLLVAQADSDQRRYRFPIENAVLRGAVEQVRAAYAERRVSVIEMIFSKPTSPMRTFSDAFRLLPIPTPPAPPAPPQDDSHG